MQGTANLLTRQEMASVLNIAEHTLETLVSLGAIPHTYIQLEGSNAQALRFNPYLILDYFMTNPALENIPEKDFLKGLQTQYQSLFPGVMNALKNLDAQIAPRRNGKGYYLQKVPSKRYGFLYYVRYSENGKVVRSRWNTHTNNLQIAEHFAVANRETILAAYHAKNHVDEKFYTVLETYYAENSPYMTVAKQRGRTLGEKSQRMYRNFINNTLIPFLRKSEIHCAGDITQPVITKLQNMLLGKNLKRQTVNRMTGCVKQIFDHLILDGTIDENPFRKAVPLTTKNPDSRPRGCYETALLKGAFNTPWPDTLLLCLLIYSTGLRNSEIERIRLQDIIELDGLHFINVRESKTENGIRLAPLHGFVYEHLLAYAENKERRPDETIFQFDEKKKPRIYLAANVRLAENLGIRKETLAEQNIVFYSGRHFWKTLMNEHELGDIEEYFMGHKVSSDVAKRYNHRDKQGRERITAKARVVLRILDKALFGT